MAAIILIAVNKGLLFGRALGQIFGDARLLAFQTTQVVQLGAAHFAATLHGNGIDRRAMRLEDALDAGAVRNLAHGECGVETRVLLRDDDAFVGLHALAVAFFHLDVDHDGVAGAELRQLAGDLGGFELLEEIAHVAHQWNGHAQYAGKYTIKFLAL